MYRLSKISSLIAIGLIIAACSVPDDKYVASYILLEGGCARVSLFMNKERTEGVANIKECKSDGSEPVAVYSGRRTLKQGEHYAVSNQTIIQQNRAEQQAERNEQKNSKPNYRKSSSMPMPYLADALARERLNCDVVLVDRHGLIHIICEPYDTEAVALLKKGEDT